MTSDLRLQALSFYTARQLLSPRHQEPELRVPLGFRSGMFVYRAPGFIFRVADAFKQAVGTLG